MVVVAMRVFVLCACALGLPLAPGRAEIWAGPRIGMDGEPGYEIEFPGGSFSDLADALSRARDCHTILRRPYDRVLPAFSTLTAPGGGPWLPQLLNMYARADGRNWQAPDQGPVPYMQCMLDVGVQRGWLIRPRLATTADAPPLGAPAPWSEVNDHRLPTIDYRRHPVRADDFIRDIRRYARLALVVDDRLQLPTGLYAIYCEGYTVQQLLEALAIDLGGELVQVDIVYDLTQDDNEYYSRTSDGWREAKLYYGEVERRAKLVPRLYQSPEELCRRALDKLLAGEAQDLTSDERDALRDALGLHRSSCGD
jgi:hypothetical protein